MKNLITVLLLSLTMFACKKDIDFTQQNSNDVSNATSKNKRIYFTNTGNWVDQNFNYNPGDTFVLKAGINYTYFSMANVHDIVFINEGGIAKLQNGFNFNSCTNITITGTGSKDFYGIEIAGHTSGDVGIDINGKSSHITCNNIYIHDKTYGFWVKQEVASTCDQSLYYPNWYMDSIFIHHCMIKRMNQEGMYIGSTGENADRVNGCGQYPYPMRLKNVHIYNNIVDSTGRGGIMLSGADKGKNIISGNTVTRCGYEMNSYQGNGIVIGGNAYANIDSNTIKNTLCDGIWVLGCGTTRVRNNKIDSSGWLNGQYAGYMHGIAFDTRPSFPFRQSTFRIKGNKIGKHTDVVDIYIYNTPQNLEGKSASGFSTTNNLIYNNKNKNNGNASVATQGGIVYSTTP
ncbi:MAG: right-handed parallel beta-helix repeat-containing protein [Bacteroidetes bacterium]|nr:right-handed parallel beta-helix repeat-containing protein [Bacteroidota bacterium]